MVSNHLTSKQHKIIGKLLLQSQWQRRTKEFLSAVLCIFSVKIEFGLKNFVRHEKIDQNFHTHKKFLPEIREL